MASRLQNSTATQNRPALARARMPRSGSRATPKRMRTSMAKGATCWVVTCERSSTRRSLPAMRRGVTEQGAAPRASAGGRATVGGAADDRARCGRPAPRPGRARGTTSSDRGAGGHRLSHEAVEQVAAVLVEAGVGLVEQPQLGATGQQAGERGAPPLAGREPGDGQVGQAAVEPAGREGGGDVGGRRAAGPRPRTARCR